MFGFCIKNPYHIKIIILKSYLREIQFCTEGIGEFEQKVGAQRLQLKDAKNGVYTMCVRDSKTIMDSFFHMLLKVCTVQVHYNLIQKIRTVIKEFDRALDILL